MRGLVLLLLLAGCVDHGQCLRSHRDSYWQPTYTMMCDGKGVCTQIPTGGYVVEYDQCDEYQFPNGRPK